MKMHGYCIALALLAILIFAGSCGGGHNPAGVSFVIA
jgi:hypothetical protein